MSAVYICHYSEIGLKGGNRRVFERQLIQNIKRGFETAGIPEKAHMQIVSKRVVLTFEKNVKDTDVRSVLENIFGLVHFGLAKKVENDISEMEEACLELFAENNDATFAIRTKRSNKAFSSTSNQINVQLGAAVLQKFKRKVDLTNPEVTCFIEILDKYSYIYLGKNAGSAGLPVGVSGKVLVMMSGGIDSPVAAYLAMKRGAKCEYIHFHSFPYTNMKSQEKVQDLVKCLNKYQFQSKLHMIPFSDTQEDIVLTCPDKLRIILYRRFMMRAAERMARRIGAKAIVTGESLGQVASQTLANMAAVEAVTPLPVLRPLIGMDKTDIIQIGRKIGTYLISKLPHDDVCTRFMPEHPEMHAKPEEVLAAEKDLDIDEMVYRDVDARETLVIK